MINPVLLHLMKKKIQQHLVALQSRLVQRPLCVFSLYHTWHLWLAASHGYPASLVMRSPHCKGGAEARERHNIMTSLACAVLLAIGPSSLLRRGTHRCTPFSQHLACNIVFSAHNAALHTGFITPCQSAWDQGYQCRSSRIRTAFVEREMSWCLMVLMWRWLRWWFLGAAHVRFCSLCLFYAVICFIVGLNFWLFSAVSANYFQSWSGDTV